MTCQEITDLFRSGRTPADVLPSEMKAIIDHIAECGHCSGKLVAAMADGNEDDLPPEFNPDIVEQKLAIAARDPELQVKDDLPF